MAGVLPNFQEARRKLSFINLLPDTSLMGTAAEISSKSSFVRLTLREPILLSRFLILVVPAQTKFKK